MDDVLRQCLYDPAIAHDLVLAHRPPAPTPVTCVVSDAVWGEVIHLLRWAAADTHGSPGLRAGTWWRLAAECADLLRRLPGLSAEIDEPWEMTPPPEGAGASGAERVSAAAARLAALLTAPDPVPLRTLAAHVDEEHAMATTALTTESFQDAVRAGGMVLIDWWAAWCAPCRAFAPVFEAASERHPDVVFAKVDTEAEAELSDLAGIRSIPTLMAFRDGVLVFSQPGTLPGEALDQLVAGVRSLDMDAVRAQLAEQRSGRNTD